MRERLRLGVRAIGELVVQSLRDAAVQRLAAALEQVFVGRVLDQRVLEAVFRLRRETLDQENVGLGEPFQRRMQRRVVHPRHRAQQGKGKAAPQHRTDHRDLARRAEPVKPRRQ